VTRGGKQRVELIKDGQGGRVKNTRADVGSGGAINPGQEGTTPNCTERSMTAVVVSSRRTALKESQRLYALEWERTEMGSYVKITLRCKHKVGRKRGAASVKVIRIIFCVGLVAF